MFARMPYALVFVCILYEYVCRYICCIVHTTRRSAFYMYCIIRSVSGAVCVSRALLLLFLSRSRLLKRLSFILSISKQKQQTLHTSPHRARTHASPVRQRLVAVAATTITTAIDALSLARACLPTQPTTFTAHKSAVLIFTFSSFCIPSNIQVFFRVFASCSLSVFVYLFECMGGKDDTIEVIYEKCIRLNSEFETI